MYRLDTGTVWDWKWAWQRVILLSAPCRLTLHDLSLYCTVTFFRRLRLKHYLKTLTQWGKANHFRTVGLSIVFWILPWIPRFKSFASLPSICGWVMTSMKKTQNAAYYSFVPSSTPFSVMLTSCVSCDRTGELSSYAAIHTIFMFSEVDFPWHFLLAENVFTFKRNWLL